MCCLNLLNLWYFVMAARAETDSKHHLLTHNAANATPGLDLPWVLDLHTAQMPIQCAYN